MTTPLSLNLPVATPADAVPGTPDPTVPVDAFAALLAAMTGAVPVPVPTPSPMSTPPAAQPTSPQAEGPQTAPAALRLLGASRPGLLPPPPTGTVLAEPGPTSALMSAPTTAPAAGPDPTWAPPTVTPRPWEAPAPHAGLPVHHGPVPVDQPPTTWVAGATQPPVVRREQPVEEGLELLGVQAAPVAAAAPASVAATAPVTGTEHAEPTAATRHVQPAVVEAARALRHEGGGRTSLVVRLDPPELGAVLVRLTVQDGRVDVQLRTPDLAARSDLQAQSYDVQQVLRDAGLDLTSFDVAHGDVLSGDLLHSERGDAGTPDRGTPRRAPGTDGGPGTTHVTDDVADPQPAGTWL